MYQSLELPVAGQAAARQRALSGEEPADYPAGIISATRSASITQLR